MQRSHNSENTESYCQTFVLEDEESAIIKIQAKHYEKSELIRDESTNMNVEYHYKLIVNFPLAANPLNTYETFNA